MNQKTIYVFIACVLMMCACKSKNPIEVFTYQEGEWATIASLPLPGNEDKSAAPERRVHADKENEETKQTPLIWDVDDQLDVFVQAKESVSEGYPHSVFSLLTGVGESTATFRGTMAASGNTYFVMYPARTGHQVTGESSSSVKNVMSGVYVPGEQLYHDNITFAPGLMPMVGFGDKDGFEVANAGCVLRIPIMSSTAKVIERVQLQGNQNEVICGTVSYGYSLSGKTLTLTNRGVEGDQGGTITVTMPNNFTLSETPAYIQFVMPAPVSFGNGFMITVYGAENFARKRVFSGKAVEIGYNKIHTIKPTSGAYDILTWSELPIQ